jgi:predicted chitinase
MKRAIFFATVRARLFGGRLTQAQVEGLETLLDAAKRHGVVERRQIAYVLATAYHETGRAMRPVREIGQGRGRAYGQADAATGEVYYGRGYVQITWKANYARLGARLGVDLVANPDRALDPRIAADILMVGMAEGLFTGRSLATFLGIDKTDWRGARRIVNGLDRADDIAEYARAFDAALANASVPNPSFPAALAEAARTVAAQKENVMTQSMKQGLKGYRTLAFNALVAAVGVAQSVDWVSVVGSTHAGWALTAVAIANMLLRAATDGPVGVAKPEASAAG